MSELQIEKSAPQDAFQLGNLVGRHEALGLIASRCSAADAGTLRSIRDQQLWRAEATSWNAFCETRLKMTRSNANRLIRLLEEFGPAYFHISHATRISADEYRYAVAPAVRDQQLHINGEAIALTEENDPRIAEAVGELRKAITLKAIEAPAENGGCEPDAAPHPFQLIERLCADLMAELAAAAGESELSGYTELESIVLTLQSHLTKFGIGIAAERRSKLRPTA